MLDRYDGTKVTFAFLVGSGVAIAAGVPVGAYYVYQGLRHPGINYPSHSSYNRATRAENFGYRPGTQTGYRSVLEGNLIFPQDPALMSQGNNRWSPDTTPPIPVTQKGDIVKFHPGSLACTVNTRAVTITCLPAQR